MPDSNSDIANRAAAHIGAQGSISDLETDTNELAVTMRMFFVQAVKAVLRARAWGFPRKIAALALVQTDPNTEWANEYRYPSDCLFIQRVLSGSRQDTVDSYVPYKITHDASGKVIWTDEDDASIEYVAYLSTVTLYPDDFAECLEWYLAFLAAPKLTNGDKAGLGKIAYQMYVQKLNEASARSKNEDQRDRPSDSEFIRCRG